MCVEFGEPDSAPSKAHCPCLKTAASTSSAGNPAPTDTIPAPDVSAPVPTPAGSCLQSKRVKLARLKRTLMFGLETVLKRKRIVRKSLKKKPMKSVKDMRAIFVKACIILLLRFKKAISLQVNLYAYRSNQFICVLVVKPSGVELIKAGN